MFRLILFLLLFIVAMPALAQNSSHVPQSREQITLSYAPLVKKTAPAVVNIYTKRVVTQRYSPFIGDPFFERFFGFGGGGLSRQRLESALGSGVIVRPDGLVVTNAHVIREAEEITAVLPDGREFEARKVLEDEASDLALLRIDAEGKTLPFVDLKPSESLEVGDLVLAIGNPFGVGQTVTSGIVSAVARSSLDISDFNFFIQTDAAINPGNSGGALVDMEGGLVGINTAIYSRSGGSVGLGFAIPAEMVAALIAAEEAGQTGAGGIVRPWLGITAQKITQDIADSLNLATLAGALISDLHQASPARKAGLKAGDIVIAVNGRPIRDPAEMRFRMATVPIGAEAVFDVMRHGKPRVINVKAIAAPEEPPRNETELTGRHPLSGATVVNINPAVAAELALTDERGVVVMAVSARTQAARIVRPGDLIRTVNGRDIKNVADLEKSLKAQGYSWDIIISRDGYERKIMMR